MNQLRFDGGLGVYSNRLSFNRLTKMAQGKEESETSSAPTGFHALVRVTYESFPGTTSGVFSSLFAHKPQVCPYGHQLRPGRV